MATLLSITVFLFIVTKPNRFRLGTVDKNLSRGFLSFVELCHKVFKHYGNNRHNFCYNESEIG